MLQSAETTLYLNQDFKPALVTQLNKKLSKKSFLIRDSVVDKNLLNVDFSVLEITFSNIVGPFSFALIKSLEELSLVEGKDYSLEKSDFVGLTLQETLEADTALIELFPNDKVLLPSELRIIVNKLVKKDKTKKREYWVAGCRLLELLKKINEFTKIEGFSKPLIRSLLLNESWRKSKRSISSFILLETIEINKPILYPDIGDHIFKNMQLLIRTAIKTKIEAK